MKPRLPYAESRDGFKILVRVDRDGFVVAEVWESPTKRVWLSKHTTDPGSVYTEAVAFVAGAVYARTPADPMT